MSSVAWRIGKMKETFRRWMKMLHALQTTPESYPNRFQARRFTEAFAILSVYARSYEMIISFLQQNKAAQRHGCCAALREPCFPRLLAIKTLTQGPSPY